MSGVIELEPASLVLLSGLVAGGMVGVAARAARFCTMGALEDAFLFGSFQRLRAWAVAIAVAMIGVQTLYWIAPDTLLSSMYLNATFRPLAAGVGGLIFGLGMSLVGTCGFGVLVRLAGGDLKSLFTLLLMGFAAYMTANGLSAYLRVYLLESSNIELSSYSQGIPEVLASLGLGNPDSLRLLLSGLLVLALIVFTFGNRELRRAPRDWIAGIVIGLAVTLGFFATALWGEESFQEIPVVSLSYARPLGDSLIYLMTTTGAELSFGVCMVAGTLLGAFAIALFKGELRWEGHDDAREMRRHFLGALLMGFGGVTALGCTVGQGITGIATLSLSSPFAILGILIGTRLGLHFMIGGFKQHD